IILGLSLKKLVDMSVKMKSLEKLMKADHRDIQTQTKEFIGKPNSALHSRVKREFKGLKKKPTLIYSVTLQEVSNDRGSMRAN
ncbi:hypothetical protein ACQP3D_29800, partial [Escherichia coli]